MEEVEVKNVGDGGVASEETLKKLLEAIKKLAIAQGKDPYEQIKKAQQAYQTSIEKSKDAIDENTAAFDENNESVVKSTKNFDELNQVTSQLKIETQKVNSQLDDLSVFISKAISAFQNIAQSSNITSSILSTNSSKVSTAINDSSNEIKQVGDDLSDNLDEMEKSFNDYTRHLVNNIDVFTTLSDSILKVSSNIDDQSKVISNNIDILGDSFKQFNELEQNLESQNKILKNGVEIYENLQASLLEYNKTLVESAKSLAEQVKNSKIVKSTLGGLNNILHGVSATLGFLYEPLKGFITNVARGNIQLSEFVEHIPLFGSYLVPFFELLDNGLSVFQRLSKVGASFNNSISEMRQAAALSKISLDTYSYFVMENSKELAGFGGTVTKGVKRLSDLNVALGENRQRLLNMGLNFEDINETLSYYQYLTRAGSAIENRNAKIQAEAAASYAENLMTLSKLTGKSIDQIKEEQNAKTQDMAFQMELSKLGEEERSKVMNAISQFSAMGPGFADIAKAAFLGLTPVGEEARLIMATMGDTFNEITSLMQSARDPLVDLGVFQDKQLKSHVNVIAELVESGKNLESVLKAGAVGIDGIPKQLLEILSESGVDLSKYIGKSGDELRNLIEKDIKEAEKEAKKRNETVESLTKFQDKINDLRINFETKVLGPLIEKVGPVLNSFIDQVSHMIESSGNIFETIKDKLFDVLFGENTQWTTNESGYTVEEEITRSGGLIDQLKNAMVTGLTDLFTNNQVISALLTGIGGVVTAIAASVYGLNQIGKMVTKPTAMGPLTGSDKPTDFKSRTRIPSGVKGLGLLGLGVGAYDLLSRSGEMTNEELGTETSTLAGATAGGVAGAKLGAMLGLIGGPVGAGIGSFVGGVGGAIGGGIAGSGIYQYLFGGGETRDTLSGGDGDTDKLGSSGDDLLNNTSLDSLLENSDKISQINSDKISKAKQGIYDLVEIFNVLYQSRALTQSKIIAARFNDVKFIFAPFNEMFNELKAIDFDEFIDISKVINNLGKAFASFKSGTGFQGFGDFFASISGQDVKIGEKINKIAGDLSNIKQYDLSGVPLTIFQISDALKSFTNDFVNQFSTFNEFTKSILGIDESIIGERINKIAGDLFKIKQYDLSGVPLTIFQISDALTAFNESTGIKSISDLMSRISGSNIEIGNIISKIAGDLFKIKQYDLSGVPLTIFQISDALTAFNESTGIKSISDLMSRISGSNIEIGNIISKIAGDLFKIKQYDLSGVPLTIFQISDALTAFNESTGIKSISDLMSRISGPNIEIGNIISKIAGDLSHIDSSRLSGLGKGIEELSIGLGHFGSSSFKDTLSSISDSILSFFTGDSDIADKIIDITNRLSSNIEPSALSTVSKSIGDLNTAFSNFKGIESFSFDHRSFNNLERLSLIGDGLNRAGQGISALSQLAEIKEIKINLSDLNNIDHSGIDSYTSSLKEMKEVLSEINSELKNSNNSSSTPSRRSGRNRRTNTKSAGPAMKDLLDTSSNMETNDLTSLNKNVILLLNELKSLNRNDMESINKLSDIVKAIEKLNPDLLR